MFHKRPERPYLETWLRRTRRQLAVSGRLTEVAMHLARQEGNTPAYWCAFIREVLDEDVVPSLDLLTQIDFLLAKPARKQGIPLEQPLLF